jgi:hypothetical protein
MTLLIARTDFPVRVPCPRCSGSAESHARGRYFKSADPSGSAASQATVSDQSWNVGMPTVRGGEGGLTENVRLRVKARLRIAVCPKAIGCRGNARELASNEKAILGRRIAPHIEASERDDPFPVRCVRDHYVSFAVSQADNPYKSTRLLLDGQQRLSVLPHSPP